VIFSITAGNIATSSQVDRKHPKHGIAEGVTMADLSTCIAFANENPICFLATTEGDQPHVRALGFWFADPTGFYFQTGAVKELYKQIVKNPKIEVCYFKAGPMAGTMLRVAGSAELLDERKLKERVLLDRPFLKDMGLTSESYGLILFRIAHGIAHFWTMANNLKPKETIEF
jgi:pyridoxamine 5'-phosphate oxidase